MQLRYSSGATLRQLPIHGLGLRYFTVRALSINKTGKYAFDHVGQQGAAEAEGQLLAGSRRLYSTARCVCRFRCWRPEANLARMSS
jgi:hypothetical protein